MTLHKRIMTYVFRLRHPRVGSGHTDDEARRGGRADDQTGLRLR